MKGEIGKHDRNYWDDRPSEWETTALGDFHTDYEYTYRIDGKDILSFELSDMPGQCGASIAHNWKLEGHFNEEHYQDFIDDLKEISEGTWAKILASATLPDSNGDAAERNPDKLYNLLRDTGWEEGLSAKNPNSGNVIAIFELTVREDT